MEELKKGASIQSLQVGLSIVRLIALHGQPMTFKEISEQVDVTKSNLYKYLNTLTQIGMLHRDKKRGTYTIGSKVIEFGMVAANQEDVIERAAPFLRQILKECKETVLLSIWTANGPLVVKMLIKDQGVNLGAQLGTHLPMLSATGKLFAAFMDVFSQKKWIENEKIARELDVIRREQIAFAREPLVPFVSSVAIPIFNFKQQLLGVMTVVGFSDKIPQQLDDDMSQYLLQASREISKGFGYDHENIC